MDAPGDDDVNGRNKLKKQFKWRYNLDVVWNSNLRNWKQTAQNVNKSYSPQILTCLGIYSVKTSSSKENMANLVLVSMWTSVKVEEKRHKQFEATKYRNTLI